SAISPFPFAETTGAACDSSRYVKAAAFFLLFFICENQTPLVDMELFFGQVSQIPAYLFQIMVSNGQKKVGIVVVLNYLSFAFLMYASFPVEKKHHCILLQL